jgi:hypothetical protein
VPWRKAVPNATLLDLPLEILTGLCQQLGPQVFICVAETCKRLRHGDGGPETVELPTKSPVVTALRKHAFPREDLILNMRPAGCSESWVAYLARCVRQRRCREAPPIAAQGCECISSIPYYQATKQPHPLPTFILVARSRCYYLTY